MDELLKQLMEKVIEVKNFADNEASIPGLSRSKTLMRGYRSDKLSYIKELLTMAITVRDEDWGYEYKISQQ